MSEGTMSVFEVKVTASAAVVVEADSEEEAMTRVTEEMDFGDFCLDEVRDAKELKTAVEIKRARTHADIDLDAE